MIDGHQLGRQYGSSLGDYALGLQEVEAAAQEKADEALRQQREELARSRAALTKAESVCGDIKERLDLLAENRRIAAKRREESPAQYSLVKGLLYLGLSILLILADISILGQVIARFLGYTWRSQSGQTFAHLIFTDVPKAFRDFPDLFCLTIAILLIGFFIKVWRDSYLTILGDSPRRIDKAEFWLYSCMLLLALIAVIAMAAARLTLDVGGSQGWPTRIVSTILGLALPVVGAGFFLKGYDSLAERWELWRLSVQQIVYSLLNWRWQSRVSRLKYLVPPDHEVETEMIKDIEVAALRSAFSQGYKEGVVALFSSKPNLTEKIQPLVVARLLENRRQ
jgi:hypothetical protein